MRAVNLRVSNEKPLLLTGTFLISGLDTPGEAIQAEEEEKRVARYKAVLARYIKETEFDPIVLIENSGYPFPAMEFEQMADVEGKRFEFLSGTPCAKEVKAHGKGYGDALLIQEALERSKLLADVPFFYKMTGRLFLENHKKILRSSGKIRNEFISYDGMGWIMTWFFKANRKDYLRIMKDVHKQCDDKSLRDMEICFWLRLYHADADIGCFPTYPLIDGRMGNERGAPYCKGKADHLLRCLGVHIGIFTMHSFTGRCFWKLYRLITGRSAYVSEEDSI